MGYDRGMKIYRAASELFAVLVLIAAGIQFSGNMGGPWWLGVAMGLGIYGVTVIARLLVRPFRL